MSPAPHLPVALKNTRNTQVLFPQGADEHVVVLRLKLVDGLDEVALTVIVKVNDVEVLQLILGLDVVDTDLVILHQLLHEIHQRGVIIRRNRAGVETQLSQLVRCTRRSARAAWLLWLLLLLVLLGRIHL